MSEERVELTRRLVELFNRHDVEGIKEITVEDAEIVPMRAALEGTVFRGPTAVEDFFAASDESWEELRMYVDEVGQHGGRVLAIGRLRGRARETGMEVDSPMGWVVTFGEGRIASVRTYVSVAEAREAADFGEG
jgi:ketosteroid isomerase-like protein